MTPEERKQAHASCSALGDSDWETVSQALDDLMRKLLVVHRLLEARSVSLGGGSRARSHNAGRAQF